MSSDTARGLRYWLQVNNLDHQETVPLTVLEDAIEQGEARRSRRRVCFYCHVGIPLKFNISETFSPAPSLLPLSYTWAS
jgi:hypothetical protein